MGRAKKQITRAKLIKDMEIIKKGDSGPSVEDVQTRLSRIELLDASSITSHFDDKTADAIKTFCKSEGIEQKDYVDEEVWSNLVDASFVLGDRTLYLRAPHFFGADVKQLQKILGILGFSGGKADGTFGGTTEAALRQFQQNMGLPNDGICGAFTYQAIKNIQHSWEGKEALRDERTLGFARAAKVLESRQVCLFGTDEFTRSVASRMSNLALATTPSSKILSADALSVPPTKDMLLLEIKLNSPQEEEQEGLQIDYEDDSDMSSEIAQALKTAKCKSAGKISINLKSNIWNDAGKERSAQHYAITLLDALCIALGE